MVINADPGNLNTVVSSTRPLQLYLNNIEILFIRNTTGILGFVGFLENLVIIFHYINERKNLFTCPFKYILIKFGCRRDSTLWSSFQLVHKEYYLYFINAGKFIAFTMVGSLLLLTSLNKFMSVKWHSPSLVGHDDRSAGTLSCCFSLGNWKCFTTFCLYQLYHRDCLTATFTSIFSVICSSQDIIYVKFKVNYRRAHRRHLPFETIFIG